EVQDVEGVYASQLAVHPEQHGHADLADMNAAMAQLPEDQREALVLVAAFGFSYEEAAEICSVAVGTIKSRVNRARNLLAEILHVDSDATFGPDATAEAVIGQIVTQR